MVISFKDSVKLLGVTVVCFCAVFVCTFFGNFYLDVLPLKDSVPPEMLPLYDAQLAMAQMCMAVTGGVLALVAAIMLIFYVKLYVDSHSKLLGTLKALGYSAAKLATDFLLFGLSAFVGCLAGYALGHAAMPFIYEQLAIDGLNVEISYHVSLLFILVILPSAVMSAVAYLYARKTLCRSPIEIMRGESKKKNKQVKNVSQKKDRPFLLEISLKTVSGNKSLTFFVTLSCFCFSSMIQMGWSMESLVSGTMGWMIIVIGITLAVTSVFMAMTSLIRNNSKTVAMLKTFGYSLKERSVSIFGGYVPFVLIGFVLGTVYQYGLLSLMINVIFKNVGEVPDYSFDFIAFSVTLGLFALFYVLVGAFYIYKLDKTSLKIIMTEE